ncbi:hypothetical protein SNE40_022244 [Patella caerulea]|uniref:Uncharacterized protein n=1 Tax=Patella caerulea TaxID=87958 RepID=A0AAN8G078_PATCE
MIGGQDITKQFLVIKALESMKRGRGIGDSRLPVSITLLRKILMILPSVCADLYEVKLFRAAFTIAFFGLFKIGELTCSKGNDIDNILAVDDIVIDSSLSVMKVTLRHSKTDQWGKGITVTIPSINDNVCAVYHMAQFLVSRPGAIGPVFLSF